MTVLSFVHEAGPAPGGAVGFCCRTSDKSRRWSLRRAWPAQLGQADQAMVFVMLNPSTADHRADDATIRRCRSYAVREGCTSLEVVNLITTVAVSPAGLRRDPPDVTAANDRFIMSAVDPGPGPGRRPLVVLAWGANADRPQIMPRAVQVLAMLNGRQVPFCALGATKIGRPGGWPVHPLRQRADAPLIPLGARVTAS